MPPETQTAEALAIEIKGNIANVQKDMDAATKNITEIQTEMKSRASGENMSELQSKMDEQGKTLADLGESFDDLMKKYSRPGGPAGGQEKSLGQIATESDSFKGFDPEVKGNRTLLTESMAYKDITHTDNSSAITTSALVMPHAAGFVAPAVAPLNVRSLFSQNPIGSNAVHYNRELSRTTGADTVPEGQLKPQSDITFEQVIAPVVVVAHHYDVSQQAMEDSQMMAGYINTVGRYELNLKEEEKLLNGAGGADIEGLVPLATAYDNTTDGGPAPTDGVDDLAIAFAQVRNDSKLPATGCILHPLDVTRIQRMKDGNGNYLNAAVQELNGQMRIWGRRVVESDAQTPGQFLAGSFAMGAHIWDRWVMRVLLSTENKDNFERNMVTILFEKRLAFTVEKPAAFVAGALT